MNFNNDFLRDGCPKKRRLLDIDPVIPLSHVVIEREQHKINKGWQGKGLRASREENEYWIDFFNMKDCLTVEDKASMGMLEVKEKEEELERNKRERELRDRAVQREVEAKVIDEQRKIDEYRSRIAQISTSGFFLEGGKPVVVLSNGEKRIMKSMPESVPILIDSTIQDTLSEGLVLKDWYLPIKDFEIWKDIITFSYVALRTGTVSHAGVIYSAEGGKCHVVEEDKTYARVNMTRDSFQEFEMMVRSPFEDFYSYDLLKQLDQEMVELVVERNYGESHYVSDSVMDELLVKKNCGGADMVARLGVEIITENDKNNIMKVDFSNGIMERSFNWRMKDQGRNYLLMNFRNILKLGDLSWVFSGDQKPIRITVSGDKSVGIKIIYRISVIVRGHYNKETRKVEDSYLASYEGFLEYFDLLCKDREEDFREQEAHNARKRMVEYGWLQESMLQDEDHMYSLHYIRSKKNKG